MPGPPRIARPSREFNVTSDTGMSACARPSACRSGPQPDSVRFGSTVTLEKSGGQVVSYQVVGEDEADPAKGKISYVSPIARQLIGSSVGDIATLADGDAEIVKIG